jgi:hypothetical protein
MTRRKRDRLAAFRAARESVAEMNRRAREESTPLLLTADAIPPDGEDQE